MGERSGSEFAKAPAREPYERMAIPPHAIPAHDPAAPGRLCGASFANSSHALGADGTQARCGVVRGEPRLMLREAPSPNGDSDARFAGSAGGEQTIADVGPRHGFHILGPRCN